MNYYPFPFPLWLFWPMVVWTLVWKGLALWRAARNNHQIWFIVLLIFNTLGVLEILYLFIFGKKKLEINNQKIN